MKILDKNQLSQFMIELNQFMIDHNLVLMTTLI